MHPLPAHIPPPRRGTSWAPSGRTRSGTTGCGSRRRWGARVACTPSWRRGAGAGERRERQAGRQRASHFRCRPADFSCSAACRLYGTVTFSRTAVRPLRRSAATGRSSGRRCRARTPSAPRASRRRSSSASSWVRGVRGVREGGEGKGCVGGGYYACLPALPQRYSSGCSARLQPWYGVCVARAGPCLRNAPHVVAYVFAG